MMNSGAVFVLGISNLSFKIWDLNNSPIFPGVIPNAPPTRNIWKFIVCGIFTLIVFKYTIPFDSRGDENQKLKKFTLLISIIIALLGAFVAPVVVPVLFPQYVEVIDVVRIISFTIIPLTITKIFTSKLLGQEKSKQILFSKIISMIAFIIAILVLSESYGIIGISVGYLLSTIIESLCLIPGKNRSNFRD